MRLTGPVQRVSREETAAYFHSRPRGSQLGAWASPQSQVIASRAVLERAYAEVEARFGDGEIPVPPTLGRLPARRPTRSSSGRAAPTGCTTGCGSAATATDWALERLAP